MTLSWNLHNKEEPSRQRRKGAGVRGSSGGEDQTRALASKGMPLRRAGLGTAEGLRPILRTGRGHSEEQEGTATGEMFVVD